MKREEMRELLEESEIRQERDRRDEEASGADTQAEDEGERNLKPPGAKRSVPVAEALDLGTLQTGQITSQSL